MKEGKSYVKPTITAALHTAVSNAWPVVEAIQRLPGITAEFVVFENGGWAICSGDDEGLQLAYAKLELPYQVSGDLIAALGETVDDG